MWPLDPCLLQPGAEQAPVTPHTQPELLRIPLGWLPALPPESQTPSQLSPGVINNSDPKWEGVIKVLRRTNKNFTKQMEQHWQRGQPPDVHPQNGSSAFYIPGVTSTKYTFKHFPHVSPGPPKVCQLTLLCHPLMDTCNLMGGEVLSRQVPPQ